MKKTKFNLKILSIASLVIAAFTLIKIVGELIFGEINTAVLPEGAPENLLLITKIFIASFSFILLLPQIYLGIKGLWAVNHPRSSRFHVIVAIVLFALTLVTIVSPITAIVKKENILYNVAGICSIIIQLFLYFEYARNAKELAR